MLPSTVDIWMPVPLTSTPVLKPLPVPPLTPLRLMAPAPSVMIAVPELSTMPLLAPEVTA